MPSRQPPPPAPEPAGAGDSAEARWLDAGQASHWVALMALLHVLPGALEAQLKRDAGLNLYEYTVLAGLSDAPGRTLPMSELAVFASGSISRLSHAVTRLAARGWVTKSTAGRGTAVDLTLTDEGAATVARIAPGHVAEARRLVVDVLTSSELAGLGHTARHVLDAIDPKYTALLDAFGFTPPDRQGGR